MRKLLLLSCLLGFTLMLSTSYAATSPIGYWRTVSDKTGHVTGAVQVFQQGDKLYGRIAAICPVDGNHPSDRCNKCVGTKHNQPILGLTILWNMQSQSNKIWDGGRILDPKIGKIYRCKLWLESNGQKLKVRGYIGFSLLGRTQTWTRTQNTHNVCN